MLKVALVEDKAVILRGMTMVLKKEKDVELVGTAEDGAAGLALIQKEEPDLVLTDIRMPGMTGLEMIEQAQKEFPDTVFVIFSGFNEFKYVQKAIGLGVLDYLEKPVTVTELRNVLERARDIVEYKKNYMRMKERTSQVNRVMIEQQLYKLLNEPAALEKENMEKLLETGANLEYAIEFAVLCVEKVYKNDTDADRYRKLLNSLAFSAFEDHAFEVYTLSVEERLFFVYFNQECEIFSFFEALEGAKKKLAEQNIEFYGGLSNAYQNLYDLKNAFAEAQNALTYAVYLETENIVRIQDVEYRNNIPAEVTSNHNTLTFNFRLQNYGECRRQIDEYMVYLHNSGIMPELLRHECVEFISLVRRLVLEAGNIAEESMTDMELDKVFRMKSAEEMLRWMGENAKKYISLAEQEQNHQERPAEIIRKYIDQHYAESITLEALADLVHMNPAYLSVMFKKEEGISYSSYLIRVRIQEAMKLLERGMKAKDVCIQVGYYDYRYFNKQFKKIVGMTPDTYKKSKIYAEGTEK